MAAQRALRGRANQDGSWQPPGPFPSHPPVSPSLPPSLLNPPSPSLLAFLPRRSRFYASPAHFDPVGEQPDRDPTPIESPLPPHSPRFLREPLKRSNHLHEDRNIDVDGLRGSLDHPHHVLCGRAGPDVNIYLKVVWAAVVGLSAKTQRGWGA